MSDPNKTVQEFTYLLNAMEHAAQSICPADQGYYVKRLAVIAFVRNLAALPVAAHNDDLADYDCMSCGGSGLAKDCAAVPTWHCVHCGTTRNGVHYEDCQNALPVAAPATDGGWCEHHGSFAAPAGQPGYKADCPACVASVAAPAEEARREAVLRGARMPDEYDAYPLEPLGGAVSLAALRGVTLSHSFEDLGRACQRIVDHGEEGTADLWGSSLMATAAGVFRFLSRAAPVEEARRERDDAAYNTVITGLRQVAEALPDNVDPMLKVQISLAATILTALRAGAGRVQIGADKEHADEFHEYVERTLHYAGAVPPVPTGTPRTEEK